MPPIYYATVVPGVVVAAFPVWAVRRIPPGGSPFQVVIEALLLKSGAVAGSGWVGVSFDGAAAESKRLSCGGW